MVRIAALEPSSYRRHALHAEERIWPETNCYSDVIIELLHGLGHEPLAALAFTLAIDFEGDQWTFFKFPHADLLDLYGFDIQELAVWRPLVEHISDLVAAGRPVLVELDSCYLPDTVGSAYRQAHVKSTIAANAIDVAGRYLGYFHNQGYYELNGADFAEVFQLDGLVHERMLPPYFEYVKILPGWGAANPRELLQKSLVTLSRHVARAPRQNPFLLFQQKFRADLEWLMQAKIETFHTYSFATVRQFGACYELAQTYLRWLSGQGVGGLEPIADEFQRIAQGAKALQFNLARLMARKKQLDLSPLQLMAEQWDAGMTALRSRYG